VGKTGYALLFLSLLLLQPVLRAAPAVKSEFFTTSDGVKLHYLESGAGPTILFVPGWTMPANIWQPQIDYFSPNYHVVAIDPRSQGDSEKTPDGNYPGRRAQDYKELIDHLGVSRVVMVGWSLAVQESLTYVQMFGTYKLSGLVLVDLGIYTVSTPEELSRRSVQPPAVHGNLCPRHVSQAAIGGVPQERSGSIAQNSHQHRDRLDQRARPQV
jgi:pimeloyl-ACP methyl ester carboxylesterase